MSLSYFVSFVKHFRGRMVSLMSQEIPAAKTEGFKQKEWRCSANLIQSIRLQSSLYFI